MSKFLVVELQKDWRSLAYLEEDTLPQEEHGSRLTKVSKVLSEHQNEGSEVEMFDLKFGLY